MRVDTSVLSDGSTNLGNKSKNTSITSTTDLVRCLELADSLHLSRQVEACQLLFPEKKLLTKTIAGGIAAVTVAELGRGMNVVTGMGTKESVTSEDLQIIDQIYADIGLSPTIDLCPFADEKTLASLASHGYHTMSFWNTYVRPLNDDRQEGLPLRRDLHCRFKFR